MKAILASVCLLTMVSMVFAAPPVAKTPAAVDEVVYARPFTLSESFRYDWCNAPFQVSEGTILVLKVQTNLVIPRQIEEPVLYVGNQAAMRLNQGDKSGHLIVVVPGEVDLTKDLVWFGTPELPGRVTPGQIEAQRRLADQAGIKPLSAEKAKVATDNGGPRVKATDMTTLLRDVIAGLVDQYSPQEKVLSETWRMEPLSN